MSRRFPSLANLGVVRIGIAGDLKSMFSEMSADAAAAEAVALELGLTLAETKQHVSVHLADYGTGGAVEGVVISLRVYDDGAVDVRKIKSSTAKVDRVFLTRPPPQGSPRGMALRLFPAGSGGIPLDRHSGCRAFRSEGGLHDIPCLYFPEWATSFFLYQPIFAAFLSPRVEQRDFRFKLLGQMHCKEASGGDAARAAWRYARACTWSPAQERLILPQARTSPS